MGCVPSKKCVEPNVIKQVVEKCVEPNVIKQVVEKPTKIASILEAVPFLLKNIPTDVLRTNLLPYLLNSFESDALPGKPVYDIQRKYYSYSEDIIYLRSKYNPIETWETLYMIYLPLNDETRRVAVKDYLKDCKEKNDIMMKNWKEGIPKRIYNKPIGNWDTSSVIDMSFLFSGHTDFKDISEWKTSSVTDFNYGNEAHVGQKFIKWDTYNVVMPYRPEIAALYEISYYKGNKMRY